MYTRQDYISGNCSQSSYYAQYVTKRVKMRVEECFGEKIAASNDEHFNDIPLRQWDFHSFRIFRDQNVATAMKKRGDSKSKVGLICIMKEAARQIKKGK